MNENKIIVDLKVLVDLARVRGFRIKDITRLFNCSESTIRTWRHTRGFPLPSGPTRRLLTYDFNEVIGWGIKNNCLNQNFFNEYINKNNINNLSIYSVQQGPTTSPSLQDCVADFAGVQQRPNSSSVKRELSAEMIRNILKKFGFDINLFDKHMNSIVENCNKRKLQTADIEQFCEASLNNIASPHLVKNNQLLSALLGKKQSRTSAASNVKVRDFKNFL